MKCLLCEREAVVDLCQYHQSAKAKVESTFKVWAAAYGTMDWKDYLHRVKVNSQTGQWAKEIAGLLEGD